MGTQVYGFFLFGYFLCVRIFLFSAYLESYFQNGNANKVFGSRNDFCF